MYLMNFLLYLLISFLFCCVLCRYGQLRRAVVSDSNTCGCHGAEKEGYRKRSSGRHIQTKKMWTVFERYSELCMFMWQFSTVCISYDWQCVFSVTVFMKHRDEDHPIRRIISWNDMVGYHFDVITMLMWTCRSLVQWMVIWRRLVCIWCTHRAQEFCTSFVEHTAQEIPHLPS